MIVNTYEGLLALLAQNKIRFMLVGGLAVALNGFVRTTGDMGNQTASILLLS